jgi:hypothetical protein
MNIVPIELARDFFETQQWFIDQAAKISREKFMSGRKAAGEIEQNLDICI